MKNDMMDRLNLGKYNTDNPMLKLLRKKAIKAQFSKNQKDSSTFHLTADEIAKELRGPKVDMSLTDENSTNNPMSVWYMD